MQKKALADSPDLNDVLTSDLGADMAVSGASLVPARRRFGPHGERRAAKSYCTGGAGPIWQR